MVIGAGGTGTYFLKEVSRFIHSLGNHPPVGKMMIIDGDIVERKNIDRQCFQEEDIGLYKSAVMADILNCAFSLSWEASGIFLDTKEQLHIETCGISQRKGRLSLPMIVGCVDNHACRMVLEDYFNNSNNCIYLDSANEYSSGEVVFSMKINGEVISPLRSNYFPEIKKEKKTRSQMSCTELNAVSPQHTCTNMLAGNILLSEFASICEGRFHGGMIVFDSKSFDMQYISYTENHLLKTGGDEFGNQRERCKQINEVI